MRTTTPRSRTRLAAVAGTASLALVLTACGGDDSGTATGGGGGEQQATGKVGVILPDTASSARWETADRPFLADAFEEAGVEFDIQNAQGDTTQFQTIADQMITSGANVLMITNLDSGSGRAVIERAASQGVPVIDYDRLTLGGESSYYVSFDNRRVGELQGQGLVDCLAEKGYSQPIVATLNGSPTDNNATLFAEGYNSVLDPLYDSGELVKGPDQSVPEWDNQQAGTIFEQMLTTEPNIQGVLAANDGLGNAAISVLRRNNLNGQVPVTGQDATVQGLQNILLGDQCMTVYKAVQEEAAAAAELAIALAKGEQPEAPDVTEDPEGQREVPSVLLEPQIITKDNINVVVEDGFVTREELCGGQFEQLCTDAGV